MSRVISSVNTSDTFQVWLQRTNDLVSELGTSVMTASALGDTTTGNATLFGSFSANTIVVGSTLRTGIIDTLVGNTSPLEIRSQTYHTSTNQTPVIIKNSLGPRIRIQNNNVSWLVGVRGGAGTGTNAQFVIGVEGSDFAFRIGTDGTIYANNIILDSESSSPTGVVRANRLISTTSGITGGGNLTVDRTLSLTGQALALHELSTNGIITRTGSGTVAARTLTSGTGITISNGNGVGGNPTIAVDSEVMLLTGAQTVTGTKTFNNTIQGSISGNAATVTNGVYTTGAQTIGGAKTFSTNIVVQNTTPGVTLSETDTSQFMTVACVGSALIIYNTPGASIASFTQGGNFAVAGSITAEGNVTAYSDRRIKTNIRTIDNALSKVVQLRGVYYDHNGKAGTGVVAQEIETILPEVVVDGEYKSVAYGNIVGVLIEAIKELKAELDILKRGD